MSVTRYYNADTGDWELIGVGVRGPVGAPGLQGPEGDPGTPGTRIFYTDSPPSGANLGDIWVDRNAFEHTEERIPLDNSVTTDKLSGDVSGQAGDFVTLNGTGGFQVDSGAYVPFGLFATLTNADYLAAWDGFTGDGNLNGRVAPSGQTWTVHLGGIVTQNGYAIATTADNSDKLATIDVATETASTNVIEVGAFMRRSDNNFRVPTLLLFYVDNDNYMTAHARFGSDGYVNNDFEVRRVVGGTMTTLASASATPATAAPSPLRAVLSAEPGAMSIALFSGAAHAVSYELDAGDEAVFGSSRRFGLGTVQGRANGGYRWDDFYVRLLSDNRT